MKLPDQLAKKINVTDDCWVWTAYCTPKGYGRVMFKGRVHNAYRLVYELLVGPVGEGLELDHLCRNRACVRPEHLEAVTHAENMRRAPHIAAQMARTHCPQGHAYDEANTYNRPDGSRVCRICTRASLRRSKERRKVAA